MVLVLILDLKTDNDEGFFISFGTSFHISGPRLVICQFQNILYVYFYSLDVFNFYFPENLKNKNLSNYFILYFIDFCS